MLAPTKTPLACNVQGCRKYTEGLGEAYDGDIAFAQALETFGGGHDDPISVAVGGQFQTLGPLVRCTHLNSDPVEDTGQSQFLQ